MNHKRTTRRATRLFAIHSLRSGCFAIVVLVTLLLLAAASQVQADGTWTKKTPAASPSARCWHAMASLGGDQALLFGGDTDGGPNGDTWVYDLSANTWTNQARAVSPSARDSHALAWLGGDEALLFGGWDGSFDGETWVYDLSANTWTNMAPPVGPSARHSHALAWLGGDEVLLFGGYDEGGLSGETWVYDLSANTWTDLTPAVAPSALYGHAMVYLGGDQVLLFGGYDGGSYYFSDTWVYDLSANTWTEQAPAVSPSARWFPAMASFGEGQALLFGGWDGGYDDETWLATGFFTPVRVYLPVVAK